MCKENCFLCSNQQGFLSVVKVDSTYWEMSVYNKRRILVWCILKLMCHPNHRSQRSVWAVLNEMTSSACLLMLTVSIDCGILTKLTLSPLQGLFVLECRAGMLVYSTVCLWTFSAISVYVFTVHMFWVSKYFNGVWRLQAFSSARQMCSLYPAGWGHVVLIHLVEMHIKSQTAFFTVLPFYLLRAQCGTMLYMISLWGVHYSIGKRWD